MLSVQRSAAFIALASLASASFGQKEGHYDSNYEYIVNRALNERSWLATPNNIPVILYREDKGWSLVGVNFRNTYAEFPQKENLEIKGSLSQALYINSVRLVTIEHAVDRNSELPSVGRGRIYKRINTAPGKYHMESEEFSIAPFGIAYDSSNKWHCFLKNEPAVGSEAAIRHVSKDLQTALLATVNLTEQDLSSSTYNQPQMNFLKSAFIEKLSLYENRKFQGVDFLGTKKILDNNSHLAREISSYQDSWGFLASSTEIPAEAKDLHETFLRELKNSGLSIKALESLTGELVTNVYELSDAYDPDDKKGKVTLPQDIAKECHEIVQSRLGSLIIARDELLNKLDELSREKKREQQNERTETALTQVSQESITTNSTDMNPLVVGGMIVIGIGAFISFVASLFGGGGASSPRSSSSNYGGYGGSSGNSYESSNEYRPGGEAQSRYRDMNGD